MLSSGNLQTNFTEILRVTCITKHIFQLWCSMLLIMWKCLQRASLFFKFSFPVVTCSRALNATALERCHYWEFLLALYKVTTEVFCHYCFSQVVSDCFVFLSMKCIFFLHRWKGTTSLWENGQDLLWIKGCCATGGWNWDNSILVVEYKELSPAVLTATYGYPRFSFVVYQHLLYLHSAMYMLPTDSSFVSKVDCNLNQIDWNLLFFFSFHFQYW